MKKKLLITAATLALSVNSSYGKAKQTKEELITICHAQNEMYNYLDNSDAKKSRSEYIDRQGKKGGTFEVYKY